MQKDQKQLYDEIISYYSSKDLDAESEKYLYLHAKRFAFLLKRVISAESALTESGTVLDIGPSFLTEQINKRLKQSSLYALGFSDENSRGGHFPSFVDFDMNKVINFDLNNSCDKSKWVEIPPCDIVTMAEVIEHLYTSPVHVLRFIHSFLKDGGTFILQTPNAVSLDKRLRMLSGKNPYEQIRPERNNPGHFREYTMNEMIAIAESCGFELVEGTLSNYFDFRPHTWKMGIYRFLQKILGKNYYDGFTLVLKKK